jgi:hypothetical protein
MTIAAADWHHEAKKLNVDINYLSKRLSKYYYYICMLPTIYYEKK